MFLDLELFEEETEYSIALLVAKTQHGSHCGILTKEKEEIKFYHLAWHKNFRSETKKELLEDKHYSKIKWVRFTTLGLDMDPDRDRVIPMIQRLTNIFKKNENLIGYGLNYENTKFTATNDLELGENEHGLTCATFVACYFKSVDNPLIDLSSWPSRLQEDNEWKEQIVAFMKMDNVPEHHIEKVVEAPVNRRVKPEEITVSCAADQLPANFEFCSVNGALFNDA